MEGLYLCIIVCREREQPKQLTHSAVMCFQTTVAPDRDYNAPKNFLTLT